MRPKTHKTLCPNPVDHWDAQRGGGRFRGDGLIIEKICTACGEPKADSEFSPDRRKKDGLQAQCKQCRCTKEKARHASDSDNINKKRRERRVLNPEPLREYEKRKRAANPEKFRERSREFYKKHKERRMSGTKKAYLADRENRLEKMRAYDMADNRRRLARRAVSKAIKDGRLIKCPCEVCGDANTEAHHDDYDKPLDVRWLCRSHHRLHHAAIMRADDRTENQFDASQ